MSRFFIWRRRKGSIDFRLFYYDVVTSTNDLLKEMVRNGESEGAVVVAEEQTSGRGRFDRKWISPRGGGLYFSLLLQMPRGIDMVTFMPIVAGVAVAQVLRRHCRLPASIKWPNDILLAGRKVGGILCEGKQRGAATFVIVGIGVNLNLITNSYPPEVRARMTALNEFYKPAMDKFELLWAILKQIEKLYLITLDRRDKVISFWNSYCVHMNHKVIVKYKDHSQSGWFRGINESGAAMIELPTSETIMVSSAEFSLEEDKSCY